MNPYADIVTALFPGARLVRAWPLAGGVSAVTQGLELAHGDGRSERVVVRQMSTASFKASATVSSTVEHDLLAVLHAAGLPVPRPRHVDDSCTLLPTPYVVCDFVDGTSTCPGVEQTADAMASLLARVHAVDPEGLPPLPRRDSPVDELADWVDAAVVDRAARAWRGGREPALLHGDYWPGNLLWQGDTVVGLVDWEDAAVGDPLSDLACARVELLCALDEPASRRFTERYLAQTGVQSGDLAIWDVYVSSSALASMNDWGLAPDVLARRERDTRAFLDGALARLAG